MILSNLGKYRTVKWLGGGQFGDVYLVFDTILEKEFALKVARMRSQDILMLKDEARLLASLEHSNIVRFYNIDSIEGKFILVMEYVAGRSLRSLLAEGKFDLAPALSLIKQTLTAVAYAHHENIIHRDLKPENILVTDEGIVKVTDFGLAKFIKPGSLSASVAGTPIYMAPEAWQGKFLPQSDIYSLGTIIYEMLTGRAPFLAESLDDIRKLIFSGQPVKPSVLNPKIPESLQKLILDCLDKDFNNRPDASVLLEQLSAGKKIIRIEPVKPKAETKSAVLSLTPQQKEVVESTAPRLLVLGAAGTGKTTTLVYKVYHTIRHQKIDPARILVATFTKKAAADVRSRLERLVGGEIRDLWLDTTHTIGYRILKRDIGRLDRSEDFLVIEPRSKNFRFIVPGFGFEKLRSIFDKISLFKSNLRSPEEVAGKSSTTWDKVCAEVYKKYEARLKEKNLLDFDDLIFAAVKLLSENEDLREYYGRQFSHIFVDELQDLSVAQYRLLQLLASFHKNIFLTGDEDQSIYGWRGAKKELVFESQNDFDDLKVFLLTRNFRLPEKILNAANNLIAQNKSRRPQETITTREGTGAVELYSAETEDDEAYFVGEMIAGLATKERKQYSDCAVLYRLNSQSRAFEETLTSMRIPYTLVGSERFYEREEVKHLVDLLQGIRQDTLELALPALHWVFHLKTTVSARSRKPALPYFKTADGDWTLAPGQRVLDPKRVKKTLAALNAIKKELANFSPFEILETVLGQSGFLQRLKRTPDPSAFNRLQNIEELVAAARKFNRGEVAMFLEHLALLENLELVDWGKNTVKLMTVHSAKGLEFPVVFLVGMIEGVFPLVKNLADTRSLEEERRLCFVGITRSLGRLYVSYPKYRFNRPTEVSRFIPEMLGM
jgi:DNA helicase-2/ATP-dependent DNA helicase PcrA